MNKQKIGVLILLVLTLSMVNLSLSEAQNIQDSAMCYDYGATDLQPIGVGNTIFQYTEKIGLWVQIQNPADVNYRVTWRDPSGNQFRNVAVSLIDKEGEDWSIVFDSINVAESTAKNKLGVWTVALSIDGEVEVEEEFQIISYDDLIEDIGAIQSQITGIVAEKDELLAQNEILQASLETLQADYATLQAQVGTSSDYENLLDDYESLQGDYDALQASQTSTKTMLYAAIVVALVAVVIAVYFGIMKK